MGHVSITIYLSSVGKVSLRGGERKGQNVSQQRLTAVTQRGREISLRKSFLVYSITKPCQRGEGKTGVVCKGAVSQEGGGGTVSLVLKGTGYFKEGGGKSLKVGRKAHRKKKKG